MHAQTQRLRLLSSIVVAIGGARDGDAALRIALIELARAAGWPYAQVWLPDPARGVLVCGREWYADGDGFATFRAESCDMTFARGDGLPGTAWATATPAWVRDLATEPAFTRAEAAAAAGLTGSITVPVLGQEVVAVLEFFTTEPRDTDEAMVTMVAAVAAELGAVIERKRAEDALRASEMRFRSVTRSASDAIVCADVRGTITFWNPAAARIFGWAEDEIVGRPLTTIMPARFHAAHRDGLARLLATSMPRVIGKTIPLVGLRRDGGELPVELSLAMWTAGAEIAFTAIIRDVSERRRIEQRLALADRMASVGQLASGVAHEINNPLSYVIANLGLIDEELRAAPISRELRELVEETRAGAERIRRIVRDLKTFARPDEDTRGPIELPRVLDLACNMAWNEIRHRARLVKDYGGTPPVDGNEARLGQVFVNLLVNAAHAIPEGDVERNEIRVVTRLHADGRVAIEVKDSGAGIPDDVRPHIFEPFFTTKPVGVGTGLGLAICHGIVTGLGGEIELEPNRARGHGTIVRVLLQAASDQTGELPAAMAVAPARRRGRILIVDDEPFIARTLKRLFAAEHDVTVAVDGRAALAALRDATAPYDVILCDLMMPEMSGMDLFDELARTAPDLADRVIFLTGGAFTPRAHAFLDRVANPRIEKPFDPAALRALVRDRMR